MHKIKNDFPITAILVCLNIVVFLAAEIFAGSTTNPDVVLACGGMYTPYMADSTQWYRFVTAMFLHFGMGHLLNNMLILIVIGMILEPVIGRVRYVLIYLLGGIGANLSSYAWEVERGEVVISAGASGAIFAVMGATIWALIVNRGRIQNMTTVRMLILIAFSLYFGYVSANVGNTAHLSGLIIGFLVAFVTYRGQHIEKEIKHE